MFAFPASTAITSGMEPDVVFSSTICLNACANILRIKQKKKNLVNENIICSFLPCCEGSKNKKRQPTGGYSSSTMQILAGARCVKSGVFK
jgi:hypothetical protein